MHHSSNLLNWIWLSRRDGATGRTLSRSITSWTHTPAPATGRRERQRTSWWWDTVRMSAPKANAPSERNRWVSPVGNGFCILTAFNVKWHFNSTDFFFLISRLLYRINSWRRRSSTSRRDGHDVIWSLWWQSNTIVHPSSSL